MYRYKFLIVCIFIFAACTKEVFLIEEPQPGAIDNPPGGFSMKIKSTTDTEIEITWENAFDPENEFVVFDVAVNDSVVAYEIIETKYTVKGLRPNSKYKIAVIAADRHYNTVKTEIEAKTLKSFLNSFHYINLGYDEQTIFGSISTSDGGFVMAGIVSPYSFVRNDNFNFVAKINPDYSVAWFRLFDWDLQGDMSIIECMDGNYVVAWTNTVTKLSQAGDINWQYKCPASYTIDALTLVMETDNLEILLAGVKLGTPMKNSIVKLDQFGKELLHEWDGIYPTAKGTTICTLNGEQLILGKTGKITEDGVFKILKTNKTGELMDQIVYPNLYGGTDLIHSIVNVDDNNFLLTGSTRGYIGGSGWDFCPHLIMIDEKGKIIWEKYFTIISNYDGFFRVLKAVLKINADSFILFVEDNRGFTIAEMNGSGEIVNYKRGNNYPNVRGVSINHFGQYVVLTDYGVFVFNPDGYVENN